MNYLNYHPLQLAAKFILLNNDRIRDVVNNASKINTLVRAGQICNQIGNYQKIALLASCCSPSYERSKILEQCNHGTNDCYKELGRLTKESFRDEAVERYVNMRKGFQY